MSSSLWQRFFGPGLVHEHQVLNWEILNYPWDFWTDEGSTKKAYRIGVGVCEGCQLPVMQYLEVDWPQNYDHTSQTPKISETSNRRAAS